MLPVPHLSDRSLLRSVSPITSLLMGRLSLFSRYVFRFLLHIPAEQKGNTRPASFRPAPVRRVSRNRPKRIRPPLCTCQNISAPKGRGAERKTCAASNEGKRGKTARPNARPCPICRARRRKRKRKFSFLSRFPFSFLPSKG